MKLEDLQYIFRHQTTATDTYTPSSVLDYMLIEGNNRITKTVPANELESLITTLDNFVFEGYRDRTPIFVKPEVIV